MKKIISVILAAVIGCICLTGCGPKYEKFSEILITQQYFDTVIQIISYQETEEQFDLMVDTLEENFEKLDMLYDIYNEYDGVNNMKTINKNAGITPVEVEQEIIDLLLFSKEWHQKSDGNLNVAMGSVLKVWHDVREEYDEWQDDVLYGGADGSDCPVQLPEMDLLEEKAEHIDIDCVQIDDENNTVFITDPQVQLDVGAVAKGYATELVCDKLVEMGYDNFALSAGGNVKTYGQPKDERQRWGIGIQNPAVDENWNMIGGNMDMAYFNTGMSLVCSGGYQRFMIIDGQRYHHLIDPNSLYPEEVYQGVAILCEDSGVADALSTTVFLMDPQDAVEYIETVDGAECVLVEADGTVHYSSGTDKYLGSRGIDSNTK